ncbi:hypothetical protein GHK92_12185 [Nocardioides sp. dk4132]|uniref:hypothetical protein n=1 Tax=unclassified Nocardioides TaxID=2615069 RepID=UPI0012958EB9|nr:MULTISPECIES: hypothetical protein [unclassified Nocardioides]MQW76637.1 hypothetical protein [Nocardioides sp. dk4132]
MVEPVRDLFVHVGLPKTGTTYLQETLFGSTEALARHGVDMVPRSRRDNYWLMLALRGHVDPDNDPPAIARAVDDFARELAGSTLPRAIVTDERLAPLSVEQVQRLADAAGPSRLHLVVTLRSFSRIVPSAWQQRVKAGITEDLDAFIDSLRARQGAPARVFWAGRDLPELLERWSAHVPPERVHVVPMPASRTSTPTLLERFCEVVGVPADELTEPADPVNASIGRTQTDLLRLVNEVAPPELRTRRGHGRRNGWHVRLAWLGVKHLGSQDGDALKMPAQWRQWCEEVAAGDIEFLRGSGVQVHGDLEDLRPRDGDFTDAAAPSDEQLLQVAARALSDIVAERAAETAAQPQPQPTPPRTQQPAASGQGLQGLRRLLRR